MKMYTFLDNKGSFRLEDAQKHTAMYFPLASDCGLKSAITPELAGDAKLDQNHFLYEPVSAINLHNNKSTRNFWVKIEGRGAWSATGSSAMQQAMKFTDKEESVTVEAGYMWHRTIRENKDYGIQASITSFIPADKNMEINQVEIKNINDHAITIQAVAAYPIYGRSADNIRDHRHVTSLLHRVKVTEKGIIVNPTLSFDERGHQLNDTFYFVKGMTGNGDNPVAFYPDVNTFIGEGGSLEQPEAIYGKVEAEKPGYILNGQEALGGLEFASESLQPGESTTYIVFAGCAGDEAAITEMLSGYKCQNCVKEELDKTGKYWENIVNVSFHTGDETFNQFMNWVSFQPDLRRVFGCSFLPHHDYGKGGRGWRDLWQDCLALLLMNPGGVRQMLVANFAGVRVDGTNATIIGEHLGEFKADRNSITRVWMDHGVWPFMTTKLYIDQTGDLNILLEQVKYFKDRQVKRGTAVDGLWDASSTWQQDENGREYEGTILEHLVLQALTAFWEVGEHNHIRMRDADWNDALDMAGKRGESVAFTNAYAKNLVDLAGLLNSLADMGVEKLEFFREMQSLFTCGSATYDNINEKLAILDGFAEACKHNITGEKITVDTVKMAENLEEKGKWIMKHIRETEWVSDGQGNSWYNGYYDNDGKALEGLINGKSQMMLTGQVFSIMSGTATKEQVAEIAKSADKYLYDESCGGYRLNTNFEEIKLNLGRMSGFAFGEKENGAVFSHMAVMYGNAFYQRGFAREGYKSLNTLYRHSMDFANSHIYPGLPEYFGKGGRGLYHYLTGAASWYMLTVINQMFGVRGEAGNLILDPKLMAEQFDAEKKAGIELNFACHRWNVVFTNERGLEPEEYSVKSAVLADGTAIRIENGKAILDLALIKNMKSDETHTINVTLG